MKKLLSLVASMCLAVSAVSFTASAEEYESYPDVNVFANSAEQNKMLSDGIKDGKYFADFNNDGRFDIMDVQILTEYYVCLGTGMNTDEIDWDNSVQYAPCDEYQLNSFFKGYDTVSYNDITYVVVNLDNEMLTNVMEYGDVYADGVVNVKDALALLEAYYAGFEAGDVDGNGVIDANDASHVIDYYACKSTGESVDTYTEKAMKSLGDLNGDSAIDAHDASVILDTYVEYSVS